MWKKTTSKSNIIGNVNSPTVYRELILPESGEEAGVPSVVFFSHGFSLQCGPFKWCQKVYIVYFILMYKVSDEFVIQEESNKVLL